jgi:hypothetical protein
MNSLARNGQAVKKGPSCQRNSHVSLSILQELHLPLPSSMQIPPDVPFLSQSCISNFFSEYSHRPLLETPRQHCHPCVPVTRMTQLSLKPGPVIGAIVFVRTSSSFCCCGGHPPLTPRWSSPEIQAVPGVMKELSLPHCLVSMAVFPHLTHSVS